MMRWRGGRFRVEGHTDPSILPVDELVVRDQYLHRYWRGLFTSHKRSDGHHRTFLVIKPFSFLSTSGGYPMTRKILPLTIQFLCCPIDHFACVKYFYGLVPRSTLVATCLNIDDPIARKQWSGGLRRRLAVAIFLSTNASPALRPHTQTS
ncbi:hypothetical protein JAAARDRAFT_402833 [Jaapia argillacea MUCL 33604]|uniref:Uncharacterized protein n=1 Tax=Jaapia argillacea MUCL 33604 TaxID=933084 RepID=A0A067PSF3_9AGAM|nr:hypothetical protein JAAARDRAFT_402833 [Jaapia argillacea MUCL 33604]